MKLPKIIKPKKHIPEALKNRSAFSLIARDPYVDWFGSLGIAVIISLVLIIIGVMNYFSVVEKISAPISVSKSVDDTYLDTKTLDKIIGEFDKRANDRKSLINEYAGPGDPSL